MTVVDNDFEIVLEEERARIVRLCVRYTHDQEAAEDLAQETLVAAWKNKEQLRAFEKRRPWLSAIARNVCLNWLRRQMREQAVLAQPVAPQDEADDDALDEVLPDEANLEVELERHELAALLDRALALLPADTAQMLVEHYVQEASQAEIAEKMGINAGTVAVRLQRGKLKFQRLLLDHWQDEALAFGLLSGERPAWETTNMWCPRCGQSRLLGQYEKKEVGGTFALRCPACSADPEGILVGLDLSIPFHTQLLGNVKSYKPAHTRLGAFTADFYRKALAQPTAAKCPVCSHAVIVNVEQGKKRADASQRSSALQANCPACGWKSNSSSAGMALALPEVQRFWRDNPRIQALPAQEVESQGGLAYVTRMQSVTGAAEIVVIMRRDTFAVIGIHSNVMY